MSFIRGYTRSVATAYGVATFHPANRPSKRVRNRNKNSIAQKLLHVRAALTARMRSLTNKSEQGGTDSYLEDRLALDAVTDSDGPAALAA